MVQTYGTLKSLSWEFQVCKTQSWHPLELSKRRVPNTTVPGEHPDHTMENAENQSRLAVSMCIQIALAVPGSGYTVPGTDCGSLCIRTTQSVLNNTNILSFHQALRHMEVDADGVYVMPSTD